MRYLAYILDFAIVLLLFSSANTPIFATDKKARALDTKLAEQYRRLALTLFYEDHYKLADSFKRSFIAQLSVKETFYNPFTVLGKEMYINQSNDGRLRIFSWDEVSGGTCHQMAAVAQFIASDGELKVQELDKELDSTEWQHQYDILYTHLYDLKNDSSIRYLTIGWGTFGNGAHFKVIQVFTIASTSLQRCRIFENDSGKAKTSAIIIETSRMDSIGISVDVKRGIVTYDEFSGYEDLSPTQGAMKKRRLSLDLQKCSEHDHDVR